MYTYIAQIYYLCPQNKKSKIMPTNKNASIRYQALDKCFGRTNKKYFIEDLIEACNEALYEFNGMNKNTGERSSVKRRQIFDDIRYMESEAGWQIQLERLKEGKRTYYRYKDPISASNSNLSPKERQNNSVQPSKPSVDTAICQAMDGWKRLSPHWRTNLISKTRKKTSSALKRTTAS